MKWLYYTHDGNHQVHNVGRQSTICAVLGIPEPRTPSQMTPFLLERDGFVPQREQDIRSHIVSRAGRSATVSATSGLVSHEGQMLRAQSATQTQIPSSTATQNATQSHVAGACGAQSQVTKSRPTLPLRAGMGEWWGGMCYVLIKFHWFPQDLQMPCFLVYGCDTPVNSFI